MSRPQLLQGKLCVLVLLLATTQPSCTSAATLHPSSSPSPPQPHEKTDAPSDVAKDEPKFDETAEKKWEEHATKAFGSELATKLDKLAQRIVDVWNPETTSVIVTLDTDSAPKSQKKPSKGNKKQKTAFIKPSGPMKDLIVRVGWWKDFKPDTPLSDVAAAQHKFFDALKTAAKITSDELPYIEVVQSPIRKPRTNHGNSDLLSSLANRARKSSAVIPPAQLNPGQTIHECGYTDYHGTLGAILKDAAGNSYALTNDHVLKPRPACVGKVAPTFSDNGRFHHRDRGFMTAKPAHPGTVKRYAAATTNKYGAIDAALVKIRAGISVSCKLRAGINTYRQVTGVFPVSPHLTHYSVHKFGTRTGFTRGRIVGYIPPHNAIPKNSANWGYDIVGVWPNLPHNPHDRNPQELAGRGQCYGCPNRQINDRDDGLADDIDMRSYFSARGDSGSMVYNNRNEAVCLIYGGLSQDWGAGYTEDHTYCQDAPTLLANLNRATPLANFQFCQENNPYVTA